MSRGGPAGWTEVDADRPLSSAGEFRFGFLRQVAIEEDPSVTRIVGIPLSIAVEKPVGAASGDVDGGNIMQAIQIGAGKNLGASEPPPIAVATVKYSNCNTLGELVGGIPAISRPNRYSQ